MKLAVRWRALVLSAALVVSMAACGDGGEDSKKLPKADDMPSASATPTKSGRGYDRIPQSEPKRPKDVRSDAGAIEFSAYVVEMIDYTLASNDLDALDAISDPKLCRSCDQVRDGIEDRGDRRQVLDEPAVVHDEKMGLVEGGFYNVTQQVDYSAGVEIDLKSGEITGTIEPEKDEKMTVNLQWRKGQWTLLDYVYS